MRSQSSCDLCVHLYCKSIVGRSKWRFFFVVVPSLLFDTGIYMAVAINLGHLS